MYLYEVGVSSTKYHGVAALTYASETPLAVGTLVEAPLRNTTSLGVVLAEAKPDSSFKPKLLSRVYQDVQLPPAQLELLSWLRVYYPAPLSYIVQLFVPPQVGEPSEASLSPHKSSTLPPLTREQSRVLKALSKSTSATALLHGETGTGKTRVYLELARQRLRAGESCIILVPEIGLTPQMIQAFSDQFPGQVRSIHSGLTPKQRRETWRQIHDSPAPQVVIGPRSALFMPVRNLGLIVVDEAHDNGYKQDQLPYYEATRVAAKLAGIAGGLCLYGTATPRVADYYHLSRNNVPILRMTEQVNLAIKQPTHLVIDTHDRQVFDRSSMFAEPALAAMADTLAKNEQVLVFLNRRGTARFVSCSSCGWHAACPICDSPLTYHGDTHELRCHTCGIMQSVPTSCPECGSPELRYQRRGTKALQSELQKLFPEARIKRFDSDNTKEETLARQYDEVAKCNTDIIVGTQVIAKGLDLSHLSLVCIPQADVSSYLPDFTADEQTFQLLRQVIGRVGRTKKSSRVIVQTFHPNSPIIQAALDSNWSDFYNQHLDHRKNYNFPPYAYLLQLTTIKASAASARKAGETLKTQLQKMYTDLEVLGPAPRFHEKIRGKYQWQLVVKARDRSTLLKIIKQLPAGWRYNLDPTNLL